MQTKQDGNMAMRSVPRRGSVWL